MPIDLKDYTIKIRDSLKRGGFACVYVASTQDGKPSRIGYAVNLHQAIATVQHHCPSPVLVEEVLWLPDRAIATNVAKVTQSALAHKTIHGGWFDEDASKVAYEMHMVAVRIYPNITMATHNQLVAQWRDSKARQREMVVAL